MKEIQLFNSTAVAIVDDEDFERLSKFVWSYHHQQTVKRTEKYQFANTLGTSRRDISMANEVLLIFGKKIDHKDRNPLNNQKANLRFCDMTQNQCNTTKSFRRGNTSRYKGVFFRKDIKKWHAEIQYRNKQMHLGHHVQELAAALAYDRKANELFGEFAFLNFPGLSNTNFYITR